MSKIKDYQIELDEFTNEEDSIEQPPFKHDDDDENEVDEED